MRRPITSLLLCATLGGCDAVPPPPPSAARLLAAARHAIGADSVSVTTIVSEARVTAPGGAFRSAVHAAAGGRFRIALGETVGGVDDAGGWLCGADGRAGPLDGPMRTILHGHDLHMLVVDPLGWLRDATVAPPRRWGNDSVLAVEFRDELAAPLSVFYRIEDTLPVGLQLVNHGGEGGREVSVFLDDWRPVAGLTLFGRATFVQDGNEFVHRYLVLVVDGPEGADLGRTCPAASGAVAGSGDRGPVSSGS